MNDTPTVRSLIDLEDDAPSTLFAKALDSETYLWPLARWPIAAALSSVHLNVTAHSSASGDPSRLDYLIQMLRGLVPNPRSTDWLREQIDHLFFVIGGTKTSAPKGVGNWLSDGFAQSLEGNAAVVQDLDFDIFTPGALRPANQRTWTEAPASVRVRRRAKANPLSSAEEEHLSRFLKAIYSHLADVLPSSTHATITQTVLNRVRRLKFSEQESHRLLDRTNPRHIYMEEAAYGSNSNLIRIAHERGIEVAELQHGWIGASHAAYNYGRAWFDSPLTSSLPDTLLTFGSYWGENLRFPGKVVPVGKPHLEQGTKTIAPFSERQHRVLVISSVLERERLISKILLLRQLLPTRWSVSVRPHPSERDDAEELFSDALVSGVTLDNEIDVIASIGTARSVVGMVSTVLFEAIPADVHIGVIGTELTKQYSDSTIFPLQLNDKSSFRKFVETLTSGIAPDTGIANAIWHPNAIETFLSTYGQK